jgi:myo-inositol 2-dehydrogenase/D-chiro-inositol 1-dehydrogenase
MIEAAAGAGKHVFCEKPISLETERTYEAIEAARVAGVKLQVGFHRRFDPDYRRRGRRSPRARSGRYTSFAPPCGTCGHPASTT